MGELTEPVQPRVSAGAFSLVLPNFPRVGGRRCHRCHAEPESELSFSVCSHPPRRCLWMACWWPQSSARWDQMCPRVRCGLCVTADWGVKASGFLETDADKAYTHIRTTGPHLCSRKYTFWQKKEL